MKKFYYPLCKILEEEEFINFFKIKPGYCNEDSDGATLSRYITLLEYSKSLLESLSIESMSAVVHMDSILNEKVNKDRIIKLLDTILADTPLKLLEHSPERQLKIQSYLIALRSCYIHDQTVGNYREMKYGRRDAVVNRHDPFLDFKHILGSALAAEAGTTDILSLGVAFSALCSLAHELMVQGELADSLQLYEDVLERQMMVLGEDHGDTMVTVIGICDVSARQGRGAEALLRFEQVVETKKRLFGSYHPETLATLGALAYFMNSIKQTK